MENEKVEELLELVRQLNEKFEKSLPVILTKKRAAAEMSISLTTLKSWIKAGHVATCSDPLSGRQMIPASEVYRLAQPRKAAKHGGGRSSSTTSRSYNPQDEAAKLRHLRKAKKKT